MRPRTRTRVHIYTNVGWYRDCSTPWCWCARCSNSRSASKVQTDVMSQDIVWQPSIVLGDEVLNTVKFNYLSSETIIYSKQVKPSICIARFRPKPTAGQTVIWGKNVELNFEKHEWGREKSVAQFRLQNSRNRRLSIAQLTTIRIRYRLSWYSQIWGHNSTPPATDRTNVFFSSLQSGVADLPHLIRIGLEGFFRTL